MKKSANEFDVALPTAGRHIVKISNFEQVAATETAKGYTALELVDTDGNLITTRIYGGRLAYFMGCIAKQTAGAVGGMKFTEILKYLTKTQFDVWVSYDTNYGVQVNYSEPRE